MSDMFDGEQTFAAAKFLKHFRQPLVEGELRAEFFEFLVGWPIHPELIEQNLHIGELVIVAMVAHQLGTTSPKNLAVNSERRKHHLVLHVARTQCLIIVVNDGDGVLRSGHGVGYVICKSSHRYIENWINNDDSRFTIHDSTSRTCETKSSNNSS